MFDALDSVLVLEGMSGLSVEKIAKISGVSKTTLYRRYGNLEQMPRAYVKHYTLDITDSSRVDISRVISL